MRFRARFIPVLLIRDGRLVKTKRFTRDIYLGDPINAVRIFNGKAVDEIAVLDISLRDRQSPPNIEMLQDIVNEAFVPISYGGRIRSEQHVASLFRIGVEKVILNTVLHENFALLGKCATRFGSQSLVASIDVKSRLFWGKTVHADCGRRNTGLSVVDFALKCAEAGAGEILLTSIDRDGEMKGYDLELVREVTTAVNIPVVAVGGAGGVADLRNAIREGGACAAAAGSTFVFRGPHRAVLITYNVPEELR